jgi:hypothetical protein
MAVTVQGTFQRIDSEKYSEKLKVKRPVAQIGFLPEHSFASCFAALFTHLRFKIHSIRELVPLEWASNSANCPAECSFSSSGIPKTARKRDSRKVLPAKKCINLFGQDAVKSKIFSFVFNYSLFSFHLLSRQSFFSRSSRLSTMSPLSMLDKNYL